ncbi:glycosyltransferase [Mesobacillus maritimus]|uniref:glycosyltransferase n=1 Tax=Mesobacillus maritimus TaxID=1643336 RepID=UPI00204179E8|nr:glycosyltransferase [Mesobacillus maritimus]MCM3585198.1 glycosyltransferase [Mesobacillus maritimus]
MVEISTPVFLLGSVGIQNGGLTSAAFTRANLLSKYINQVPILTINFHRNLQEVMEEQYKRGRLERNVKAYNLFTDLDPKKYIPNCSDYIIPNEKHINENGYVKYKDKNATGNSFRYFKNGFYEKYKRFDGKGKIISVDLFSENWQRKAQEIYDEFGNLVKVRYMDKNKNKPKLDRYLSKDGTCYMTVTVNVDTGQDERFYLHSPTPIEFGSLDDLLIYWINKKVSEFNNPILMCEKREHVNIFTKLKGNNLKKFFILHNNHFAFPHVKGSKVDPSCSPLFNNIETFDKVIVLTKEQKKDIVEDFGNESKFEVISHVANPVSTYNGEVKQHHAVTMARYAHQKSLHEAINAFRIVVDQLPDATYSIYGYGELKGKLQQLINDLKLQNNVFLEDFSVNPVKKYQEAACSILTSKYEGFGLVLLESLAAGTPIVTYRTKYGPEDIVRHGIDGYLVDIGDRKSLARNIINIMENSELRKELSENARQGISRFSNDIYKEKWLSLFNLARKN